MTRSGVGYKHIDMSASDPFSGGLKGFGDICRGRGRKVEAYRAVRARLLFRCFQFRARARDNRHQRAFPNAHFGKSFAQTLTATGNHNVLAAQTAAHRAGVDRGTLANERDGDHGRQ